MSQLSTVQAELHFHSQFFFKLHGRSWRKAIYHSKKGSVASFTTVSGFSCTRLRLVPQPWNSSKWGHTTLLLVINCLLSLLHIAPRRKNNVITIQRVCYSVLQIWILPHPLKGTSEAYNTLKKLHQIQKKSDLYYDFQAEVNAPSPCPRSIS